MTALVSELNSLDFNVYIGGPLQAAIQAQHAASMSQVDFIQSVGFDDSGVKYVDFAYSKAGSDGTSTIVKIQVPLLTMLTIPALRIEEMTIDFNAKLTSVQTANVSTEFAASAALGINYKIVNFKAAAAYKRSTNNGFNVEKTYTMAVHVKAVNDELPAGLDRILTLLEEGIKDLPAAVETTAPKKE
jgi:Protein of unknown function (DUF2589)